MAFNSMFFTMDELVGNVKMKKVVNGMDKVLDGLTTMYPKALPLKAIVGLLKDGMNKGEDFIKTRLKEVERELETEGLQPGTREYLEKQRDLLTHMVESLNEPSTGDV